MDLCVGNRATDRYRATYLRDAIEARPDSGLGRAIAIPEFTDEAQQVAAEVGRQRLAGADGAQLARPLPTSGQQQPPSRWRGIDEVDALGLDQRAQALTIGGLRAVGNHHAR